jgi:CBS domain containing-hemolysin-like protein
MGEVEMIEQVFELDDIAVREIMIPRPDVVSVPPGLPLSDLTALILDAGHTRYPVIAEDDGDRVGGYVDVKDVLRAIDVMDDPEAVTAADLAREVTVVPETTPINELLSTFQREQTQMAVVIDEWGGFEGIATVEDVVEEVVGDIRDEFDVEEREPSIDRRRDGSYAVHGSVAIPDANERLGADFESDAFATVGGFVLDRLGRAPEAGDSIVADSYELTVERVDGARIGRIRARPLADETPEDGSDDEDDG